MSSLFCEVRHLGFGEIVNILLDILFVDNLNIVRKFFETLFVHSKVGKGGAWFPHFFKYKIPGLFKDLSRTSLYFSSTFFCEKQQILHFLLLFLSNFTPRVSVKFQYCSKYEM